MARKNHQHQRPASRDSLSARYKDIGIKSVAAANIPVKEPKAANNPERHSRNHNDGRRKSIEDERERDKLSTNLADPLQTDPSCQSPKVLVQPTPGMPL